MATLEGSVASFAFGSKSEGLMNVQVMLSKAKGGEGEYNSTMNAIKTLLKTLGILYEHYQISDGTDVLSMAATPNLIRRIIAYPSVYRIIPSKF